MGGPSAVIIVGGAVRPHATHDVAPDVACCGPKPQAPHQRLGSSSPTTSTFPAARARLPTTDRQPKSQLRQFSGEENIQHFDGVRGDRRKPSHLQLHYGAQGGIRDLGQRCQPKGAWWKAPGLVCGCRVAVRTGGRGPDLAAHLQSQAHRKLRMPPSGAGLNTRKSKQRVAATWGYSFRIRTPTGR